MLQIQCACGQAIKVPDEHAGKRVRCPACKAPVEVPRPPVSGELALELDASPPSAPPPLPQVSDRELRRGPILTQDTTQKSFPALIRDTILDPGNAFQSMGIYIVQSPVNLGLTIGMFCAGLVIDAALRSRAAIGDEPVGFVATLVGTLAALALRVVLFDICARILAGVTRFVPMLIVLTFTTGLLQCMELIGLAILAVAPDFLFFFLLILILWSYVLNFIAICGTYDVEAVYAMAFIVGAWLIQSYFVGPFLALALADR